ncbi:MAG: hypothetical protein ACRDRX_11260 [Pseudonocardiaceae bacterium]
MAELTCGSCGYRLYDEKPMFCINCGENPQYPTHHTTPQNLPQARVTVLVATARVLLAAGETVLLGREGDPRFVRALASFDNVGREHLEITAGDGIVSVLPRETTNGTFIGDRALPAGQQRDVPLPVTIRLAKNCYVHFEVADE